ncbi:MAG TPA: DUF2911 domain-containing protein, partial [Longimicrobiales bacterium]|nr:DUF2911 domain-containing protein [Longimicrobiales bacterium]
AEDGVTVEGQNAQGSFHYTVESTAAAIPFFETIHWPFELALVRQAAGVGEESVPMIVGRRAMPFGLTQLGDGRVQIRHPFRGTMAVDVDGNGRIRSLDASGTTRKLLVDRVDALDVNDLARDYARRDESGGGIGALSGRAEATGEIDGATIVVDHGVPHRRGREIFGRLVPFGEVWRTGANRATHLTTDADLVVAGTRVPAGSYTLFTIPGPESWTLIINSATDINGTAYDPAADFARVTMQVRTLEETVEDFTIEVDPEGYLRMRWDRTEAFVPVRQP